LILKITKAELLQLPDLDWLGTRIDKSTNVINPVHVTDWWCE